ncbi:MAG: glutathione S-transferase [Reinekea sp.]|jgi:glutathione S-transferase|uniref:glutathione S-transferase family protein n=2 Tax=Reinekea sp. TaxID=1970455 RepID=UPI00398A3B9D
MKLIIGNKNYSTWSLRPWFFMQAMGVTFEEQLVSLNSDNLKVSLSQFSPSAKVPVLVDKSLTVWDTLAICEYVNEQYLEGSGWPRDKADRALARSLTSEMHSGFSALRNELPMNIRAKRQVTLTNAAQAELERIDDIWSAYHPKSGWLFDTFSIVDAFFAPVALRLPTYGIELSENAAAYQQKLLSHPNIIDWVEDAKKEREIVESDEAGLEI